jgi:g-D-glutamyl-meso-diaminopimelate peptidase
MKVHVRNGDSLWYLSQLFRVPLELIIDSNRNMNPSMLPIGEEISIPGFVTVPYRIQSGDTFWKVATQKNVAVDALMILNHRLVPNKLQAGDILLLPQKMSIPSFQTNAPCDYKKLSEIIRDLKNLYPFIAVHSIGTSVLGKSIHEIRVGAGDKKVHINVTFINKWGISQTAKSAIIVS